MNNILSNGAIYSIWDKKAEAFIGALGIHKHPAAAQREFASILANEKSGLGKYAEDFELVCLGYMNMDGHIAGLVDTYLTKDQTEAKLSRTVIMTGSQWKATQPTE